MTQNRRIALNIIATYGRSLYALVIGLFCGRWTLMALGETDYGLYGVVGGLTVFITYFNNIIGGAIGRFYAISVGAQQTNPEEGLEQCRGWFTTAVVLNTIVPLVLIAIGYPVGAWAIENFLTIPADRVEACLWVWRFVCCSCFLGMVTIPYNSMYLAKQYIAELTIYSFVTTTLNVCCMYYMVTHPSDWLKRYAFWQCLLSILPQLIIASRACFIFPECRVLRKYLFSWSHLKQLGNFALWTAWGTLGGILRGQGLAVVTNKFFGPRVNAGYAVGGTLSAQTDTLSGSIVGAFSPAIFNAWGAKNYEAARKLAFQTCKLGTLFILVFALPLALEVDEVLRLWLKTPPQYAGGFCVLILLMTLIDRVSTGQQIAINARGKMALYQAVVGTALVLSVPLAIGLIKAGLGVYSIGYAMVLSTLACTLGRVWFARFLAGMSALYWLNRIVLPLGLMVAVCAGIGLLPRLWLEPSFVRVVVTTGLIEIVMIALAWTLVLDSAEREFIMNRFGKFLRRRG